MLSEIEKYLPKYLSPDQQAQLFADLNQFPDNIHKRLYSSQRDADCVIFQGDGIGSLPFAEFPSLETQNVKVMIVSNTCDIQPENERRLPACVVYCPLIRFNAYRETLLRVLPNQTERIEDHLASVQRQECSSMFYLPAGLRLSEDFIALLDRLVHHRVDALNFGRLVDDRLFTLSDYGFYLFLFKLSIHFTRMRDAVVRGYSD
jgi:hypothetical protein